MFGILKIRWECLECGIRFRDIRVVEKVFVVCCMLHNFMLSEMEMRDTSYHVGRGQPIGRDAIWLRGPQSATPLERGDKSKFQLAMEWGKHRKALATHLECSKHLRKKARTTR